MAVDLETHTSAEPHAGKNLLAHPLDEPWTICKLNSYVQVSWVWPLLRLGASRPLTPEDVWIVPRGMSIKEIGSIADELWQAERRKAVENSRAPRLFRNVLLRLAKRHFIIFVTGSLFITVFFTAGPLLLRGFLLALQDDDGIAHLAGWGLPFLATWYIITFCVTIMKWEVTIGACKCRLAVQHLLYTACLASRIDMLSSGASPDNLMSVDAERFFTLWQQLFLHAFLLLGTFSVLLIIQVGVLPTLIGMGMLYVTAFLQKRIGFFIGRHRKKTMAEADHRLRLTQQFLDGIRVLKMNGWTGLAAEQLAAVRKRELSHHALVLYYRGANATLGLASPCLTGFLVFSVYVLIGGSMDIDVVFPALTVLRGLQLYMTNLPLAFSAIGDFMAAHARVVAFLLAQPLATGQDHTEISSAAQATTVTLSNAHFQCCRNSQAPLERLSDRPTFSLGPLNLQLCSGDLCVICGPVGSGKSTLILGMLGELQKEGSVHVSGRIALCGQESWINSATARENVRCLRQWDEVAYESAIFATQLQADFAALLAGDQTEIGTRGINISGGQKARLALARSLFGVRSCEIFFLDDVLAAVDAHVARHIIQHALLGILRGQLRVLVANTFLQLLLPHAKQVVVLAPGGNIDAVGTPQVALAKSKWLQDAVAAMGGVDLSTGVVPASDELDGRIDAHTEQTSPQKASWGHDTRTNMNALVPATIAADGSLLVAEDRVVGVLDSRAYGLFFKDASSHQTVHAGLTHFVFILTLVVLTEAARSGTDVWITAWTHSTGKADDGEPEEQGRWFWILGFAMILISLAVFGTLRVVRFTNAIIAIGGQTHDRMMRKVLSASVPLFFDIVPNGRILNRFSKDLDSLDSQLPEFMFDFFQSAAYVLAAVLLCAVASYFTAAVLLPLLCWFLYVRRYFAATSREMKRLEGISRSPLYTHFSETLTGLVHIRAMRIAGPMLEQFHAKIDTNSALFLHQQALTPWLVHRVNMLATMLLTAVVLVTIIFHEYMDPALVGLSITSGVGLLGKLHQCVTQSIQTENHFTSVERLDHFDRIAQEEPATHETAEHPAAAWPEHGELLLEDVQLRYRPHLPLVLQGVSFRVLPGQRAGLIGRTGSGKSTCMLVILRMVGLAGGRVSIDGIDLARVPLARLRSQAVAIIPQEPYIFEGSVKQNLDPFDVATHTECKEALRATQLLDVITAMGGLDATVENHGTNFSVGQRQLLCIARAMLRRARVVLLDEASANIDATTDVLIQESIRTCFGQSTLLIIAHRLSTIADADLIVCMDRGRVVESGPPVELRQRDGAVAAMFRETQVLVSL